MGHRVRAAIRTLRPSPRVVDWSLFALVALEVASGLLSFTVGHPSGWPVFWIHRIGGLVLAALLAFKLSRVRRRLLDPDRWRPTTALSVLAAVAALGALGTGVAWALGAVGPTDRLAYWTVLSVHVGFGLALVPLLLAHVAARFRRPRGADLEGRRTAIRFAALFVAGAVVYRLQEAAARALGTAGATRRFTGSRPVAGEGNDGFPVTSWVADDPDPIDPDAWSLAVCGLVETPLERSAADLEAETERRALLDCTSGWYSIQDWRGIRVGDLLERADTQDGAAYVRFVSVTGYRWSLPLSEAREALIATRIGDEPLSHGHGAPARLVAPGRRGFQWVKWLERVEVRDRADPAQWLVTLVSGFE